jgi:hypothetical protein
MNGTRMNADKNNACNRQDIQAEFEVTVQT